MDGMGCQSNMLAGHGVWFVCRINMSGWHMDGIGSRINMLEGHIHGLETIARCSKAIWMGLVATLAWCDAIRMG